MTPMVKDPVCGKEVNPEQAYGKGWFHGKRYYFDSPRCEEQFLRDPRAYAGPWPPSHKSGRNTERTQHIDPQHGHRDIPEVSEIMRYDSFGRRIH
jgi:YHS domain-containing protein